jgi:hypothetical protein
VEEVRWPAAAGVFWTVFVTVVATDANGEQAASVRINKKETHKEMNFFNLFLPNTWNHFAQPNLLDLIV